MQSFNRRTDGSLVANSRLRFRLVGRSVSALPAGAPSDSGLPRLVGLRGLVLLQRVAVVGLRWVATAGKAGASALALWVLAALFFSIPQALVVPELGSR